MSKASKVWHEDRRHKPIPSNTSTRLAVREKLVPDSSSDHPMYGDKLMTAKQLLEYIPVALRTLGSVYTRFEL